eukprot:CAMPEP_0118632360 /NCGR_PEP_ID=MMETSP0785-20121206/405_1 /TAXON_ID=91992 /ORGANISM="Bolidomonas pacifica, Strain CCMP 1866" /LENGTH=467 /DNA_ID=CAMNT_0006523129 /DNA_START=740 /DNA_END=2146 /DNA_ORIENTATION=-
MSSTSIASLSSLFDKIISHKRNSLSALDLVASNSFVSDEVRQVLGSNLCNSYCIGLPGERFYGGCSEIDEIELIARNLACEVFGAKYCEVQLLSGMLANIAAYNALLPRLGCTVMASPSKHGGHYSHNAGGPLTRLFGANVVTTPWNPARYNVDVPLLDLAMATHKPTLLILGWSEFLFEHNLSEIRRICDRHGCKIMYDMSHVAGLVAGGKFQKDMMKYADIVTSSTGKSLHSSDHGILLYNDPSFTSAVRLPLLTSNTHFHETAALSVTLLEAKAFGQNYAAQVAGNSKALAEELTSRNFTILCKDQGFSDSHEIILVLPLQVGDGATATRLLDLAGVFVNPQELPSDTAISGANGLRLGTQVLTRRGLKEKDMAFVASVFEDVLLKNEKGEDVSNKVKNYMKNFCEIAYSFSDESMSKDTDSAQMAEIISQLGVKSAFSAADWLTSRERRSSVPQKWTPKTVGC